MRKTVLLLTVLLAGAAHAAQTGMNSCTARSGDTTTALLELYTSEGCSSCPPADEWLARFRANGLYPGRVVPLALHVDYWNYLGWEDPYSRKSFSQRQQNMTRLNRARTVYTPQFFLNGRELPHWRYQGEAAIGRAASGQARADITLTFTHQTDQIDIVADARAKDGGRADMFIVLYENNLSNQIRAGENQGRTLRHEFVARRWLGPIPLEKDGTAHFKQRLEPDKAWKADDLGVVAFVQDRVNGEVWQALARPSCP